MHYDGYVLRHKPTGAIRPVLDARDCTKWTPRKTEKRPAHVFPTLRGAKKARELWARGIMITPGVSVRVPNRCKDDLEIVRARVHTERIEFNEAPF